MKKSLFILLFALCAALVSPVNAQENPLKLFSGTGTATSATLSTYIVSANGVGNPRVQYINATADNATNKLFFYVPSSTVIVTNASASGTNKVFAPAITGTPRVVIRHRSDDTYEYGVVSSVAAGYIVLTGNLAAAVSSGDLVYVMSNTGIIPVGNATKELNASGGGIFNGTRGKPILIECYGASAATINAVSGSYE